MHGENAAGCSGWGGGGGETAEEGTGASLLYGRMGGVLKSRLECLREPRAIWEQLVVAVAAVAAAVAAAAAAVLVQGDVEESREQRECGRWQFAKSVKCHTLRGENAEC